MAELPEDTKLEIVRAFARFCSPAEVVAMVRDEFGIETTVQQVRTYNPEHPRFEVGEKWLPIFEAARTAYLENISAIPIASQAFRLNALQKSYDKAWRAGNIVLANATVEQAAKEVGGVLTNQRNFNVEKKGGSFRDLTIEERRAAVAELIRAALAKDAAQNAPGSPSEQ